MYLGNVERLALGLEGTPNPTYEQVDAAVTATGYTGFVSLEYHIDKAELEGGDGGEGGGGEVDPPVDPDGDLVKTKKARK